MQIGDLVKYIASNDIGIILDKEYECYQEDTYKVYWFADDDWNDDWWDGSDLEALCK
jgi:hypothetical protein